MPVGLISGPGHRTSDQRAALAVPPPAIACQQCGHVECAPHPDTRLCIFCEDGVPCPLAKAKPAPPVLAGDVLRAGIERDPRLKSATKTQEEKKTMSERLCQNPACNKPLPADAHGLAKYCSTECRFAANNKKRGAGAAAAPPRKRSSKRAAKKPARKPNGGDTITIKMEVDRLFFIEWFDGLGIEEQAEIYEAAKS